jgi:hypothetical protein
VRKRATQGAEQRYHAEHIPKLIVLADNED